MSNKIIFKALAALISMLAVNSIYASDFNIGLAGGVAIDSIDSTISMSGTAPSGAQAIDNHYSATNYSPAVRLTLGNNWDVSTFNIGVNLHYMYNFIAAKNAFKATDDFKSTHLITNIAGISLTPGFWLTKNVLIGLDLGFNMAQIKETATGPSGAGSPIAMPGGFNVWAPGFEVGMGLTSYFTQHFAVSANYIFSYYLMSKRQASGITKIGSNKLTPGTVSSATGKYSPTSNTVLFGISYHFESYQKHRAHA